MASLKSFEARRSLGRAPASGSQEARAHGPRAGEGATRREEVSVERVPVNEEGVGTEIGDDEVSVPVVEEEVVVDKHPVVKEEVRVRKDVAEDEEVIEEDVRREEVDIDDVTTTGRGSGCDTDLDDETRGRTDRDDESGHRVR